MALTKEQKQNIVKDLKDKLDRQKAVAFVDFTGTKVKDISSLREEMKKSGCELKVAKKTLLGIAFKDKKMKLPENLQGEVALGFSYKDQVAPFRILNGFSKDKGAMKFLGGFLEGELIEAEKAEALAEIPSREILLAQIVGSLRAPLSGMVGVLQGNLRGFVFALSSIKK